MSVATVHIEQEALLGMLRAAVEVYNRECFGYVFGSVSNTDPPYYSISAVQPCAAAVRRTNTQIHPSARAWKRLLRLRKRAPKLFPYLGDFHSHPALGDIAPSLDPSTAKGSDLESWANEYDQFGIVISIARRRGGGVRWQLREGRTLLRGSFGEFVCSLAVYQLVRDDAGKPVRDDQGTLASRRLHLRISRSTRSVLNKP